jgi:putative redox protein
MAKKTAFITQVGKNSITFAGHSDSNHWITMDGPADFGGKDAGIRPKELVLLSLGGCTGSDVASILAKKRVHLDGFELNISAELNDEHPQIYTAVHIEYVFYGTDINTTAVERAIELSLTKYCAVTALLLQSMPVTHSYRIEPPR